MEAKFEKNGDLSSIEEGRIYVQAKEVISEHFADLETNFKRDINATPITPEDASRIEDSKRRLGYLDSYAGECIGFFEGDNENWPLALYVTGEVLKQRRQVASSIQEVFSPKALKKLQAHYASPYSPHQLEVIPLDLSPLEEMNREHLSLVTRQIEALEAFRAIVKKEHSTPSDQIEYTLYTVKRAMNEAFERL